MDERLVLKVRLDWNQFDDRTNEFLKDKLIALDRLIRSVDPLSGRGRAEFTVRAH